MGFGFLKSVLRVRSLLMVLGGYLIISALSGGNFPLIFGLPIWGQAIAGLAVVGASFAVKV